SVNFQQGTINFKRESINFYKRSRGFLPFSSTFFLKKKVFYFCRKPSYNLTLSIVYISFDIVNYLFLIFVLPGSWMSNAKSACTACYLSKVSLAANNQQLL